MAIKRRVVVDHHEQEEEDQHRDQRDIMIEGTWTEWFLLIFLKYSYAVAVLFLACILPLETLRQLEGGMEAVAALLVLFAVLAFGGIGYLKIWGMGGIWGDDGSIE